MTSSTGGAPRLSLAMIVRDEADRIATVVGDATGCCDELVIVDTGSTDDTVSLAKAAGATVYEFPWVDDFAAARNAAFSHCTGDWIMWLDGDDRLPPDSQLAIREILPTLSDEVDAVFAEYRLFSPGGETLLMRYDRERLLRRASNLRWNGAVHEAVAVPAGRSLRSPGIYVEHRPAPEEGPASERNLNILLRMVEGGDRSPRTLYYLANEYRDHGRHDDAVPIYLEYLECSTLPWERYDARLYLANCLAALERQDESYAQAMAAVGEDPSRAGALMRAALYHYGRSSWGQAATLFLAATGAQRPSAGFSNEADYTHLPWDFLGVCYYRLGRQQDALTATAKAIALGSPDRERLRANLRYIAELI